MEHEIDKNLGLSKKIYNPIYILGSIVFCCGLILMLVLTLTLWNEFPFQIKILSVSLTSLLLLIFLFFIFLTISNKCVVSCESLKVLFFSNVKRTIMKKDTLCVKTFSLGRGVTSYAFFPKTIDEEIIKIITSHNEFDKNKSKILRDNNIFHLEYSKRFQSALVEFGWIQDIKHEKNRKLNKKLFIAVSYFTLVLIFGIAAGIVSTVIRENTLDFSYLEYHYRVKSPIQGSVTQIELSNYSYDDLESQFEYCSIFPSSLDYGTASMVVFSDPHFSEDSYKRGEAYLEWNVNLSLFNQEKDRISAISGLNGTALWSNDLFCFQTVILSYNDHGVFEYALFDEGSLTIRYILLRDIETTDNILFSHEYEPTKLLRDSDLKDSVRSYEYTVYPIKQ